MLGDRVLMTWTDMIQDWATWSRRLQSRFPNLDDAAMPFSKLDRDRFEAYLAEVQNLSLIEAHEEIEDFLYLETLSQDADNDNAAA